MTTRFTRFVAPLAFGAFLAVILASAGARAQSDSEFDLDLDLESESESGAEPVPESGSEMHAERLENPVAEFTGVDKITGRIITFDVYLDETVQFGALQVTPRVCYSSPEAAEPKTDAFVEVDEITLDRKIRRIFTGWMFAESPGLNAVEHAVYDVWLKSCKEESEVPPPEAD